MALLREISVATASALAVVVAFLVSDRIPAARRVWPDEKLRTELDRRIEGNVEFRGTFEDGVRLLVSAGVPIEVRGDQVLEPPPQPNSSPISIQMRNATVEQWLYTIEFQQRNGRIAHWVDADGKIHLTYEGAENPPRATQLFDVRDIIEDACAFSLQFPVPGSQFETTSGLRKEQERNLIELVRWFAEPGTWDYWGSGSWPAWGHSGITDGRMVITQTPQAQREIEVLLPVLRLTSSREARGG